MAYTVAGWLRERKRVHPQCGCDVCERRRLVAGDRLESGWLQSMVVPDVVYHSLTIQLLMSVDGRRPDLLRCSLHRRFLVLVSVVLFVLASGCASPGGLRGAASAPVGQAEAEATLEGNVEVITEDSDQGSRTVYFLIVGDRHIPLRFTTKPLNLITGTRLRVHGRWASDDTLVVTTIEKL
jgi:hypothetical protein